ncbi:MAG TPA: hypothetical protein VFG18_10525 [Xanthomonadaceae bacterium]|jgi:hypothetical protein|nr:hypothetical protein [Xanthomonadaceae bacterium]
MNVFRHPALLAAVTLALATTLFSGAVSAASNYGWDRKSYTGAQCQPAYGIQSGDFTIFQGRLRNDAAGLRWVSCAITFDAEDGLDQADTDNATVAGAFEIRVWLDYSGITAPGSFKTSCTIAARGPYNTSVTETLDVTAPKTSTQQAITFVPSSLNGYSIGNDVTIQASCLLPSKVALAGIKVYEYGRTDEYLYTP